VVTVAATIRTPARVLSKLEPVLPLVDASTLQAVAGRLPFFSLDFAELSVSVTELLVHRLRKRHHASAPAVPDVHSDAQLASALNHFGVRLNAVGRREEAEAAWAEAVGLNAGME
jgi:hypothetical protein